MYKQIVIATHNRKKAGEMKDILSSALPEIEFLCLDDFNGAPEPEETGTTYTENASIKAVSAANFTGLPSLADDAGLEIDAMNGEPGLYSKRFAGEETPFSEKMKIILGRLEGVQDGERGARFHCAISFAVPGQDPAIFEAVCEGKIANEPSGNGGFGYDPIFWLSERNCTMADLTAAEKHEISHRGKVLRTFVSFLKG